MNIQFPRRSFLSGLCVAPLALIPRSLRAERPPVTQPRATSGDTAIEPAWDERLTISVGPDKADIRGNTDRAIQAAVDYVARLGGGTVQILPGEYRLRNSVFLASHIRILGSGEDSVLVKEPSAATKLSQDSDWYDQEITLVDDHGFSIGDGVCLRTKNPHDGGSDVLKRTLVARSGKRFKLDRPLRENFWLMGESTASTLFPIFSGEEISDFQIENITLDGNREHNDNLDGNYAGCIFLQDCSRVAIKNTIARNYNGDGISWQVCHDVTVEDCASYNHTGLGLHPGSGSQRPVMRNNRLEGNDIGLFFCWGVKYGLAEKNQLRGNRVGISIGHRDTDNLIQNNVVEESRDVGVLFRPERGEAFCAHRNVLDSNRITNSGNESGIAIDVQGATQEVTIRNNELVESRGAAQRIGIRLGSETRDIALTENRIQGFSEEVQRVTA